MKRNKRFIYLGCLLLCLFMTLTGCSKAAQAPIMDRLSRQQTPVIRWGVKSDTKLFGYYNIPAKEIQGFDIDIAQAITDELTHGKGRAEFVEVTSKTRIQLLLNGNIDAIIATMTITPDRQKVIDFSDVYFNAGQSLLTRKDSHITGIDSLTDKDTIIAVKGSTSAKNIREKAPQAKVLELENYSEGFVALQSGQGDALTTDNAILMGMLLDHPDYHLAGDTFTVEPFGIGIHKSQQEFTHAVNEALATIKANGLYDQIYAKWFGQFNQEGAN